MSLKEGRALRDAGIEAVDAAGTAAHRTWRPKAEGALRQLISSGHPFTADDLRALVDESPHHPNQVGSLFNTAARRGEIRKVGYQQSSVRSRQAGTHAVWVAA